MLWGKSHEPNMLALLLEDQQVMEVQECGFVSNTSTSLSRCLHQYKLLRVYRCSGVQGPRPFQGKQGTRTKDLDIPAR